MANANHIDEVIEAIKAENIAKLKMQDVLREDPECGTCACIMGFSLLLRGYDVNGDWPDTDEDLEAFGIDFNTGEALFYGYRSSVRMPHITPEMAVRALEDLKADKFKTWDDYAEVSA